MKDNSPKRHLSENELIALSKCAKNHSIDQLASVSGVSEELLRRTLKNNLHTMRSAVWQQLRPMLRQYLPKEIDASQIPHRIGPAYRRHNELVAMTSNQKILLDELAILTDRQKRDFIQSMTAAGATDNPQNFRSLTKEENKFMGLFLSLGAEQQEAELLKLTETATKEAKRRRSELF